MTIVNRRYLQDQPHTLAGAGVSLGDTTMTLQSFVTIPDGSGVSIPITMDMFGSKGFGTLEQGRPREEQISFTGIVQNPDGTATLTGIKNVLFEYPYTETSGFGKSHAGSVFFVISNNPGLYNSFGNKLNEETIEEKWTFPSVAGDNRPVISADTDAILATELITKGELNRAIQATYLPPTVVNTTTGTTGTSTSTTLTISHVVPPGLTDSALLVSIETQEDHTISSVTYGGNPLTFEARETRVTGNLRTEWWSLLAPTAGTANLVVTMSSASYITSHVITMETVNQSTPVEAISTGANGSGTSVPDTITTLTPNAVILDATGTANNPTTFTPTAPLAELAVNSSGANRLLSTSVRSTTTAGAYALAYTISPSTNYTTKSIAIRGVSVPGIAGVNSVTGNYIDNTDPANPVSVVPLNNTTNSAPTVTDDSSAGYYVDSKWYDTANGVLYTCTDDTVGAAVWVAVNNTTVNTLNVTDFDDFTNVTQLTTNSGGTDDYGVSGNFLMYDSTGPDYSYSATRTFAETDHPGITRIVESDNYILKGFYSSGGPGPSYNGLLSSNNDFVIEFLNRFHKTGTSFDWIIGIGNSLNEFDVYLRAFNGLSTTKLTFFDGVSSTTSTVNIPTTDTWFKTVFSYVAGTNTLTVTVDGNTVFSGTPTFASSQIGISIGGVSGTAGTYLDTDYVKTNYTATR